MTKNIIITGAMGSGKSTVLNLLSARGLKVVVEPARDILAEQRSIQSEGVPEKNPKFFTQLMLSRAIYQYKEAQKNHEITIFDRGIPDCIAYANLFQFPYLAAQKAANLYRYYSNVFFFPAWEDIYTTDEERRMSFEEAQVFGDDLKFIYQKNGYQLIEVPCMSPSERAQFVQERIWIATCQNYIYIQN